MTHNLKGSLLIASMLVVLWTTSWGACHRHRACQPAPLLLSIGVLYASPTGYYTSGQGGYVTFGGGYDGGGYPGGTAGYSGSTGYPGGYGQSVQSGRHRRPGVRLGGPARPGLRRLWPGAYDRVEVLRSPSGAVPTWNRGFARGSVVTVS